MTIDKQLYSARKKITVAVPFLVYPPFAGGQLRVFNLYRSLARWMDIELVTYTHPGKKPFKKEIADGLWEIRIPKSDQHIQKDVEMNEKANITVSDIVLYDNYYLSKEYLDALEESAQTAEVVIACHPYIYPAIKKVTNKRIWYEAQDFEFELKKSMLSHSPLKEELVAKVKKIEKECCENSEIIMTCSIEDADKISEVYEVDRNKIIVVQNGADIENINFYGIEDRLELKRRLNKSDEFTAVFVGSWHGPNLIAVSEIIEMAKILANVRFVIIGNAGKGCEKKDIPQNVVITGLIDDYEKNTILSYADVALNPMPYGSGTNLKMLEYFAFGIPVITTPVGARGLKIEDSKHAIISNMDNFTEAISHFMKYDKIQKKKLIECAREYVISNFSWSGIARKTIKTILERKVIMGPLEERPPLYRYSSKEDAQISLGNLHYIIDRIGNRPLFVWGAGSGGKDTFKLLNNIGLNVKGFIDSNSEKWGANIDNIPIYSPEILVSKVNSDNKPFIIIGSMYSSQIGNQLEDAGYRNTEDYLERDVDVPFLSLM